ncbi:MAG: 16S rRNA (guanine(966)-N(2))-methyltransferase RsmD [Pseudomonadota bacterium]
MRVIAGKAKGHKLVTPSSDRVRPALDQVKEAIFNILYDVTDLRILDLFAGSGSIGIEALSRGASEAVFVEEWSKAVAAIKRNLKHCKLEEKSRIICTSVDKGLAILIKEEKPFDLIFVDPPYEKDLVNPTLKKLTASPLVDMQSRIIVEHHPKEPILEIPGLTLTDTRKYGQTLVTFLEHQKSDASNV